MRFYTLLIVLLFISCESDDLASLPQEIIIQITDRNLNEGKYELLGTQISEDLFGEWSVISDNDIPGEFSSTNTAVTIFTGGIYEEYRIQWKVSNGDESVIGSVFFRMSFGQTVCENIEANRDIEALLNLFTFDQLATSYCIPLINGEYVDLRISSLEFFNAGISISELHTRFQIATMLNQGINITDLIDSMGLDVVFNTLINEFSNFCNCLTAFEHMINVNISVTDLLNVGVTFEELIEGGLTLENSNMSTTELLDNGITFEELMQLEATLSQLWESGAFTLKQLIFTNKFSTTDILEDLNLSTEVLISEDIIGEVTSGFYVLKYFHQASNTLSLGQINTLISGMTTWRLPSVAECQMIYNNRVSLDLQTDNTFLYDNESGEIYDEYYYWRTSDINYCNITGSVVDSLSFGFRNTNIRCNYLGYFLFFPLPVIQL